MSDVPFNPAQRISDQVGHGQSVPSTDSVASLERKDRASAKKMGEWLWKQYQHGVALRPHHVRAWRKIDLIMSGRHYYNAALQPLKRPRPGEVRAIVPIMKPMFRWEVGRLNANTIGVTATPRIGSSPDAFIRARQAQASMQTWIEEVQMRHVFRTANAQKLFYGKSAYHWYIDEHLKQVVPVAVAGHEIFPLPHNAKCEQEMSGIMRAKRVPLSWLEQQDALYEQRNGHPPKERMATVAKDRRSPDFFPVRNQDEDSTLVIEAWLDPSPMNAGGEYMFMVGERMFTYVSGRNEQGHSIALGPTGRTPWVMVDYEKDASEFWGYGLLESQIAPQQEANRQLSQIVQSAQFNKSWTFYDPEKVNFSYIGDDPQALVPMKDISYEVGARPPVFHFPATRAGKDVGVVLQIVSELSDRAAGYESGIIKGRSEGRVEGGPATNILNSNAQAPIQTVLDTEFDALRMMYTDVLELLKIAWPDDKKIQQHGFASFARQMVVDKDRWPTSTDVDLKPTPLVAGGRNTMVNLLFSMRNMPGEDGVIGSELSSEEFRRSLSALDMNPPGIQLVDPAEERILWRIGQMINDGQTPAAFPPGMDPRSGKESDAEQLVEDHELAAKLLKIAMLDPAAKMYGPNVKAALKEELAFHMQAMQGANITADNVGDDIEDADALQSEATLHNAELDPETNEGQFTFNGDLVGAI